jgi:SH3-like domain-containing protein
MLKLLAALLIVLMAQDACAADKPGGSGLPVPRFASLRSGEVNVRSGPGARYPVEWVFLYRNMPVEITAEYEQWRKVRDWQGTEGWVHQSMLSGRRSVMIVGNERGLYEEPAPNARLLARIEDKVVARVLRCREDWCRVEVAGLRGWVNRASVWGVYEDEKVD